MSIQPVIVSGGVGSRLWPKSRVDMPKQFLPLTGPETLLQQTLMRLDPKLFSPALVVANAAHAELISQQTAQIDRAVARMVLEPVGRNTAAAVAVAALSADSPDRVQLILPADHHIERPDKFTEAVARAEQAALQGGIVTFGIVPDKPETGYGYIRSGAAGEVAGTFLIDSFKEKPDLATAEKWLAEGGYSWNGGMFMFKAGVILEEMESHCPEILAGCRAALAQGEKSDSRVVLDMNAFNATPALPIDIAVMEKTRRGMVVPVDMGWNDVGSWSALAAIAQNQDAQNVTTGDVMTVDAHGNYVLGGEKLVVLAGVEDLVVVDTADALLVVSKDQAQVVKTVYDRLSEQGRVETASPEPDDT